jgi:hypothetical protein
MLVGRYGLPLLVGGILICLKETVRSRETPPSSLSVSYSF